MAMTGNQANAGGAIYFGDLPILVDSVIERCLINGNTARGQGGAVYTSLDTWVKIRSSTLTDNNSQQAGAIANNGWTILVNNTIVRNSARFWSQLVNSPGSTFVLVNNIVGVDAGRSNGSVSGNFGSFGGNIITNSRGSSGWNSNDLLQEADPRIGNLANNGGPTDSIAPLPDSPAIDRGNSCVVFFSGCDGTSDYTVLFDQRGYQRAFGRVDVGAIELNPAATPSEKAYQPLPSKIRN
jgi:predicted outer membrane repeat protein